MTKFKKNTFNHIKKQSSVTEINYILVLGLIQGILHTLEKNLRVNRHCSSPTIPRTASCYAPAPVGEAGTLSSHRCLSVRLSVCHVRGSRQNE